MRFGVTVTKKIGNAVVRNRMKRRFRELLRAALPQQGIAGADHVLIGREGGVERDFAKLRLELNEALTRAALPQLGIAGADHVLIGREGGGERDFAKLGLVLTVALARAAQGKGDPPRRRSGGNRRSQDNRTKNGGQQPSPTQPSGPAQ